MYISRDDVMQAYHFTACEVSRTFQERGGQEACLPRAIVGIPPLTGLYLQQFERTPLCSVLFLFRGHQQGLEYRAAGRKVGARAVV